MARSFTEMTRSSHLWFQRLEEQLDVLLLDLVGQPGQLHREVGLVLRLLLGLLVLFLDRLGLQVVQVGHCLVLGHVCSEIGKGKLDHFLDDRLSVCYCR